MAKFQKRNNRAMKMPRKSGGPAGEARVLDPKTRAALDKILIDQKKG